MRQYYRIRRTKILHQDMVFVCVRHQSTIARMNSSTVIVILDYYLEDSEKEDNELTTIPEQLWNMPEIPFSELYKEFKGLARQVVDVVLEKDHYVDKPKLARGQVVKDLRNAGWSWNNIWEGMKQVKAQINNM